MGDRLGGKRVLVTSAAKYMGPAVVELFRNEGATVLASEEKLDQSAVDRVVSEAGEVDVLIANFAVQSPLTAVQELTDEGWHATFDALVHPLMWETAELALFLASENSNFMVGQILPFAGGATTSTG